MSQGKGGKKAERQANQCKPQTVSQDKLKNFAAGGAQRDPDSQFTGSLGHRIRHHAKDANG